MNKCKICGKDTLNKHFCSKKCVGLNIAKSNNKLYPNKKPKREKISMKCAWDECDNIIERVNDEKMRFCCNTCHIKWQNKHQNLCQIGGRATRDLQIRRSKNEIYFAELCKNFFSDVKTNEAIFNGWDADVIIEDLKVAVLWNGVWHYKKITKLHSVKQTQNREYLKIKEIEKIGYKPYIIKDMGKYNPIFVKEEFDKFLKIYDL
jgi:hypothetical protein